MVWVGAVCSSLAWVGHGLVLARWMSARGFHPMPWAIVALVLGPALWPFALAEAAAGLPYPEVIRRGRTRPGLRVLVLLDRDELPDALERQVRRLVPDCGQVVLARVVRAGGPATVATDAACFLRDVAERLDAPIVELRILYGTIDRVAETIYEEGEFAFVFRSDDPRELYHGGGQTPKVKLVRGSPTA